MHVRSPRARTVIACTAMLLVLAAMVAFGDHRPPPAAFAALALALTPSLTKRQC